MTVLSFQTYNVFFFQYTGCLSGVLPDHRVSLLLLDLRVSGGFGGAARLEVQSAHHHLRPLPRPVHRLPRGQPQHQVVRAPVILVDGPTPGAFHPSQIR